LIRYDNGSLLTGTVVGIGRSGLLFCARCALSLFLGKASAEAPVPSLELVLHPIVNEQGKVFAIDVSERIDGVVPIDGSRLNLSAPITYFAVTHVADRIVSLQANDADGQIPLKVQNDEPAAGGSPFYRHWIAERAVRFPVLVTYSALVQPPGELNGPPFGIRPSGGGVSGSGGGFLMLPTNAGTTVSRVRWDLAAVPKGSIGISTFGEGNFILQGSPEQLNQGWVMAGPVHRFTPPVREESLSAFWLGEPPFNASAEMSWMGRAYAYLARSFRYLKPLPHYRVFMRVLDTPPFGGGTALANSFMLSMGQDGPRGSAADRRETLFHEMTHQWVGSIVDKQGGHAWFAEGLTVYYTTVLPLRGGLVSTQDYADRLNIQAREYYESPARDWSAAKISEAGFADEKIRYTPYVRGALYFANLDWQIRQRSAGKRDLDAFLHPMFVSRHQGVPFDVPAWEAMLRRELGPEAVAEFHAELIDGTKTVVPASGAFGPCFKRVMKKPLDDSNDPTSPIYQWMRVTSVPDAQCRIW
jgi:M61 glycyl aminopeptidase